MYKRFISLFLCCAMLIGIAPFGFSIAANADANTDQFVNYGANIGSTARFNVEDSINFLVCADPSQFDYDVDWSNDDNWIYYDETDALYDLDPDQELVIENYYYDAETTALWYKLGAMSGQQLPEKMADSAWVFQNFTEEYQYEDWEIYSPDALIIHRAKSFVFDSEGNVVTSLFLEAYDKVELTCDTTLQGEIVYQWQIRVGDEWVNIVGRHSASVPVDYSLLANALDANKQALLRCVTRSGSQSVEGEPITVTVDTDFDYGSYVPPVKPDEPETPVEPRKLRARAGDIQPLVDGNNNVCYVTVQYLFQNREQAANSYVAQVPVGVEQSVTAIFPYVQGYLPYYENEQLDELTITKAFTENEVYTVFYKPTEVNYTVDIYFQNVANDDYSFYDSHSFTGLTGSTIPLNVESFPGMRELLHETPTIAADGSTHVEVYYDRIYYMTRVYLEGGYGIYSVYARYGADLQSHLTAPERPGYSFVGWDEYIVDSNADGVPDTGGDGIMNTVYPTVPAKNLAYVALWKEKATTQVNIVFWGQNPNDDEYSYLETQTMQVKPGTELTYSFELDGDNYPCGLEAHKHNSSCIKDCNQPDHTHTPSCYGSCIHTVHNSLSCYTTDQEIPKAEDQNGNAGTAFNYLWNSVTHPQNGYVYRYAYRSYYSTYYYNFIYADDQWYYLGNSSSTGQTTERGVTFQLARPNANNYNSVKATVKCNHQHIPECLSCDAHIHSNACYSECIEHTHTNACAFPVPKFEDADYDLSLWELAPADKQQTITVERDGNNILNVYLDRKTFTLTFHSANNTNSSSTIYTIEEKWGADLSGHWPIHGTNGRTYNKGERWTPKNSNTYKQVLVYIAIMPRESFHLTLSEQNYDTFTMHYFVELLPGESPTDTRTFNGKTFKELFDPVKANYNHLTKAEDFFDLQGFEQFGSNPAFGSNNQLDINGGGDVYFYYTRKDYKLEFYSGDDVVRTESVFYEQPLEIFAGFTNPPEPDNLERGSHEFAGWYLNPECTKPADLSALAMPAGNMALYAKWVPNYHTVRLVLQKKADGNYGLEDSLLEVGGEKLESIEVLHGTIVFSGDQDPIPPNPDNGLYKFLGWFYEDDGVELMWDFEHHPVVEDTTIYAKWSSEVLVPYTIYYKDTNGNDVAEPTVSSALAGHSLTVNAKVGMGLKPEFREGYFPNLISHSIELKTEDAENGVTYTFVYTPAEKKQYTVHYVDKDTGEDIIAPVVNYSSYAVVTETFKSFADNNTYKDHVPDAFQNTLVLSADENENHIYFYYTKSADEGVWYIEHLVQNVLNPDSYDFNSNAGDVDELGKMITPTWPVDLSTDGYKFAKAVINNGTTTKTVTSWEDVKGAITKEGLSITVYYDRIKYPYKVVYRNKDTGREILEPTVFTDPENMKMYGSTASKPDILPTIAGYTYDSSTTCTIVKDDPGNIKKNIVYVYYTEQSIRLDFEVVGPTGCGTVSPEYTRVKINSDPSATCTATAEQGFKFVGWYTNEACTTLLTTDPTLILFRPTDGGWIPTTYYAKFELGVAPLTIERENGEANQVYVYEIRKKDDPGFVLYVTVTGNGSVTIPDMPIADYIITQQNDWSWRHDDSAQNVNHQSVDGTTVTFGGSSITDQWLNGNSPLEKNQRG